MMSRDWPYDSNQCEIKLGSNKFQSILTIPTTQSQQISLNKGLTEWRIDEITVEMKKLLPFDPVVTEIIQPQLIYTIKLSRNENFYEHIFRTPLISCVTIIALSYWTKSNYRLGACLSAITILLAFFLGIVEHGPLHYVPKLSMMSI